MQHTIIKFLQDNIKQGILHLYLPNGEKYQFGTDGIEAHWVIKNHKTMSRIFKDWEFELGETYIEGGWEVKNCSLKDLLCVLRINFSAYRVNKLIRPFVKIFQEWNKISRSVTNVAHHYDLEEDFFRLFLDKNMHYSCAYFTDETNSLEQAQSNKCERICKKLLLKNGQRILDIGCGWGSMAFYIAEHFDVEITGITLSKQQLAIARRLAQEKGLKNIRFEQQDYRHAQGQYDRIVSIGMFEHVGKPNYPTYFKKVQALLADDGVALIHTIGSSSISTETNPWIRKHIFPGGSIPALSEVVNEIEHTKLILTDIEVLRLHYAQTLNHWQQRFQRHQQDICADKGAAFYRMWDFYLNICEVTFLYANLSVVFQLQIAKQHGIVPQTRQYLS